MAKHQHRGGFQAKNACRAAPALDFQHFSPPLRKYHQAKQQKRRQRKPFLVGLRIADLDTQQAILVADIEARLFGLAIDTDIDDIQLAVFGAVSSSSPARLRRPSTEPLDTGRIKVRSAIEILPSFAFSSTSIRNRMFWSTLSWLITACIFSTGATLYGA